MQRESRHYGHGLSSDASQMAEESSQGNDDLQILTSCLLSPASWRSVSNGVKGQWATGRHFADEEMIDFPGFCGLCFGWCVCTL
ncbi:hypothetical protein IFM47457_06867 [Aspergillus lentulus]|nr:hypothetical protein IFM47457_06867 [Aspergillus lentulus]